MVCSLACGLGPVLNLSAAHVGLQVERLWVSIDKMAQPAEVRGFIEKPAAFRNLTILSKLVLLKETQTPHQRKGLSLPMTGISIKPRTKWGSAGGKSAVSGNWRCGISGGSLCPRG